MKWQVVEKDDYGTDWHQVRYEAYAMQRFDTKEEALAAAEKYITQINCDNPLTKDEKRSGAEVFMITENGCFLGILDGEPWFMTDRHGNPVGRDYFELEGKAEVAVREVPGT